MAGGVLTGTEVGRPSLWSMREPVREGRAFPPIMREQTLNLAGALRDAGEVVATIGDRATPRLRSRRPAVVATARLG